VNKARFAIIIRKGDIVAKPFLAILAAGMGSRYGGLKQIDPVDDEGHLIIDFSMYDARLAGFEKVVCIIKPEIEEVFAERIGNRVGKHMDIKYAMQLPDTLPAGFEVPEGRVKPWGTTHAAMAAKEFIDAPFCIINADDFYGRNSFKQIFDFLNNKCAPGHHALVSYQLENTLTDYGHVARGVCQTDGNKLVAIAERTRLEKRPGGAEFTEDGKTWEFVPDGTPVSMNFWGFNPDILREFEERFPRFLKDNLPSNPLKCEYLLPSVVNGLLEENTATFDVIPTTEKWYGITYKEDMPHIKAAIASLKESGKYPARLWS
jgi:NDP-sugar pyrophosphorylase family protein